MRSPRGRTPLQENVSAAELRLRGEALTFAELAPPQALDNSNGIEPFLAAVERMPTDVIQLPIAELLAPDKILLRTQIEAWRAARAPEGTNTWADVSAWVDANLESIIAVRSSLEAPSRWRFESEAAPEDWLLRHLSGVKQVQVILGLACYDAIRRRDVNEVEPTPARIRGIGPGGIPTEVIVSRGGGGDG